MCCHKRILKNYLCLFAFLLIAACASQPEIHVDALPGYEALFENQNT